MAGEMPHAIKPTVPCELSPSNADEGAVKLECYGFIGDLHTCALIGLNGSMDWMCMPRFDSPASFAALLGDENNGCWRIAPSGETRRARHVYRTDTLVLDTEFE